MGRGNREPGMLLLHPSSGGVKLSQRNPTCGVYAIFNTRTGQVYIGSSVNVANRLAQHLGSLRWGTHHCSPLQAAYSENTTEFEYFLLTVCDRSELVAVEQHAMYENRDSLYNVNPVAGKGGAPLNDEQKARRSRLSRERNLRPEYNKMIRERCVKQHREGRI